MHNKQRVITRDEYYRRSQGLLSPSFHTKKVLVVGTGGGSYLVEKLAALFGDEWQTLRRHRELDVRQD